MEATMVMMEEDGVKNAHNEDIMRVELSSAGRDEKLKSVDAIFGGSVYICFQEVRGNKLIENERALENPTNRILYTLSEIILTQADDVS